MNYVNDKYYYDKSLCEYLKLDPKIPYNKKDIGNKIKEINMQGSECSFISFTEEFKIFLDIENNINLKDSNSYYNIKYANKITNKNLSKIIDVYKSIGVNELKSYASIKLNNIGNKMFKIKI